MTGKPETPRSGRASCPFCGQNFDLPGFDDEQIAGVIAAHIAANHGKEALAETETQKEASRPVPLDGPVRAEGGDARGASPQNADAATEQVPPNAGIEHGPPNAGSGTLPALPGTPQHRDEPPASGENPVRGKQRDSDSVTRSPETGPRNKPPIDDDLRRSKGAQNTKAANDEQPETNGNKKGTEKNGPKRKPQERGQEKDAAAGEHRKGTGAGPGGLKDRLLRGSPLAKKVADRVTGSSKKTSGTAGSKPAADRARPEGVKAGLEQKLTKSLQAAGASAGIPPIVTKIALKVAKRGVPILAAFTLVVIATLFGATFDADAPEDRVYDVALSDQLDIPDPYLDAYIDAARSQKIPWTLLAAIGANATYHGRIDPYKQTIPLPAARTIDDENAETIIVLTDGTLANAGTYLDALLAPQGYTVEIVPVPTGTIDRGAAWLDENGVDGARKLVVSLGGDETVDRQQFAEKVDRLVNTVGPYYPIIWVNLDGENAGPYNEVLREKDARRQNLRIVDWAGTSDVRGFAADATGNYDDEAQRTRAGLIAASVTGNAVSAGLPVSGELSGPGVLPTPTGDCPTLAVPVEGETPAQGAGPLMLLPAALVAAGYDLGEDVQNICDSADVLAEILAETARGVADEVGTTFPRGIANLAQQAGGGDSEAAEQVHDFWALVADRSGVLGTTEERECLVPEQGSLDEQSYVGNAIDSYWRCALANVELASVADVAVDAAGNVSYRTLSPADAVARGVDEALTVSWNASNWGTADCDETAVHAGVFPLDAVVFERYAPEPDAGRCDVEQNIIAAAEAFIAGESTPVATRRGRWNASIGGWSLVGPVAGPTGAGLFDALGPWEPLTVETSCSRAFVGEVLAAARDATLLPGMTAAQAQELAYAGSTDEFDSTGSRSGGAYRTEEELIAATSGLDRRLEAIVATLRTNPDCVQERPYADDEWLGVLAGAVNGDAVTSSGTEDADLDIPARTSGNLDVPASAGDRVLMIAGRAFSRAVSYGGVAAETGAYVQRLSPVRVALAARPGVSSEDGDRTLSLGSRLINVAVGYYGGIFVGNTGAALVGFGFLDDTVPYHEEFNAVGQEYGVDPRLLAAVAKQESNFDPEAGCPSEGAFGMMQKEFDTTPTLCGDVRRQIATAAEMLLDLQRRAGDWKGALWGYNNGALFADTWAELNGDVGAAETFAYSWYRGNGTCAATGECRRAEIAMDYISETPGDRSAMLNWLDYQRLFPSSVFSSRQTTVNGNQCPNVAPLSSIPGRTVLRDGAEDVGVRELCVEAVAAAPTPEAARAIIFAFNNLGVTYSQDLRSTASAFDCSSYVSRAYESAGVLMNSGGTHFATRHLFPHSGHSRPEWVVPIAVHAAKPGDLVFPSQGHVAMLLPRGFIIHTNATGDVSKVERGYANPLQTNRVVTEIAPRIGD